jgi:hypothetical protein
MGTQSHRKVDRPAPARRFSHAPASTPTLASSKRPQQNYMDAHIQRRGSDRTRRVLGAGGAYEERQIRFYRLLERFCLARLCRFDYDTEQKAIHAAVDFMRDGKHSGASIQQPPEFQSSQSSQGATQTAAAGIAGRINSNIKLHILTYIIGAVLCAIIWSLVASGSLPVWGAIILIIIALIASPAIACLVAAVFLRGRYLEFISKAKAEQDEFLARREERRRARGER